MSVIPIYNCFHPALKVKTDKIEQIDSNIKQMVDDMFDTMYNVGNGVGLAANQVGKDKSLVVIDISIGEENAPRRPIVMINPEIIGNSDEEIEEIEGCLSVPEFWEKVIRPVEIKVKYWDLDEKEIIQDVDGFLARCMQHEIDHLNGILFYERISQLRKTLSKNKLKKLQKGLVVPDYPMIQANGKLTVGLDDM